MFGCTENELLDRRHKLEARISTYERQVSVILNLMTTSNGLCRTEDSSFGCPSREASDDLLDLIPMSGLRLKRMNHTPFCIGTGEINRLSIKPIAMIEFELCKAK